jgi:hypothetical protein
MAMWLDVWGWDGLTSSALADDDHDDDRCEDYCLLG